MLLHPLDWLSREYVVTCLSELLRWVDPLGLCEVQRLATLFQNASGTAKAITFAPNRNPTPIVPACFLSPGTLQ